MLKFTPRIYFQSFDHYNHSCLIPDNVFAYGVTGDHPLEGKASEQQRHLGECMTSVADNPALDKAFDFGATPQGEHYWQWKMNSPDNLTSDDISFMRCLYAARDRYRRYLSGEWSLLEAGDESNQLVYGKATFVAAVVYKLALEDKWKEASAILSEHKELLIEFDLFTSPGATRNTSPLEWYDICSDNHSYLVKCMWHDSEWSLQSRRKKFSQAYKQVFSKS